MKSAEEIKKMVKQKYRCQSCNRQFYQREKKSSQEFFEEYLIGKQTYDQFAKKNEVSIKTIQRKIDKVKIDNPTIEPREVIILMDTTNWSRNFGVMLF